LSAHYLITGNMGYVGPAVARQLRASHPQARLAGVDVGFFAHCLTGARQLPETLLDVQHFADIRALPDSVLDGVDVIVNLAAISNDPMGKSYEAATMAINNAAAVRLAERAKVRGARAFVFASSCSVYGFAEGGARTESDPLNPLTAYARSKIDTEEQLRPLAGPGFRVTCLRFPTACGMSDRLRLDLVLNDFVAGAVAGGRIQILSDGTPWRPLIDTRDMALAIDWASDREGDDFVAVNVGTDGCNYQVRELAEMVASELQGVGIEINRDAPPDKRSYQVDFGLYAQMAPDHLPRHDLRASVQDLIEGFERMAFRDTAFRESRYMRLKVLADLREQGLLEEALRWTFPGAPGSASGALERVA
jgi:nucleoside-diphosphate-sugar epimerase